MQPTTRTITLMLLTCPRCASGQCTDLAAHLDRHPQRRARVLVGSDVPPHELHGTLVDSINRLAGTRVTNGHVLANRIVSDLHDEGRQQDTAAHDWALAERRSDRDDPYALPSTRLSLVRIPPRDRQASAWFGRLRARGITRRRGYQKAIATPTRDMAPAAAVQSR